MAKSLGRLLLPLILAISLTGCIPRLNGSGKSEHQEYIKGRIVSNFPSTPLYPKAEVVESYAYKGTYGAAFVSQDELKKVIDFYNSSLTSLGWESNLKQVSETNYVFDVKNKDNIGSIIVNTASDGKKTAITVSLAPR